MSAKSLGQIHTVNNFVPVNSSGEILNVDLPGALTDQLQRMVRQGNYFKVVGIDMSLDTVGTLGGGQVSGFIRYYAPTKGRCEAFRGAFKSMRKVMDLQGISMRDNKMYDFKCPINDDTSGATVAFPNRATLDGLNGLSLRNDGNQGASIFHVHNESVRPTYTGSGADLFDSGFDTLLQPAAGGTDFVLNDTIAYSGNHDEASLQYEEIPFMLSWTPDTTDIATSLQWRPDPALFLAVLCGQMQVYVEEINVDGGASAVNLKVATMVSGWKSIMGNPDRKSKKTMTNKKK
jgi:hypothetical protein